MSQNRIGKSNRAAFTRRRVRNLATLREIRREYFFPPPLAADVNLHGPFTTRRVARIELEFQSGPRQP